MKKCYIFVVAILLILVLGTISIFVVNSSYFYSKKLVTAIREENIEEIESILEKKPECVNTYPELWCETIWYKLVESHGESYPLNVACRADNIEIVKVLVEAGADVNCNDGYTPLATTYGPKQTNWYEISLYLIENGASLEYTTEYSGESLSVFSDIVIPRAGAANENYVPESEEEVYAAFYYAVNHCNYNKVDWNRVLQDCVTWDRVELVEFLLDENYCDVNDSSGDMTPLMFAARDSTPEMVAVLLERGADKDVVDSYGKTAYNYAVDAEEDEIIKMLEKVD